VSTWRRTGRYSRCRSAEARVVVGPQFQAGTRPWLDPARVARDAAQVRKRARHDGHACGEAARDELLGGDVEVVVQPAHQPLVLRQRGDDGAQVEVAVRQVEGHDAAGRQARDVEVQRLAGQEVHGDRVRAVGVEHEHVERLRGVRSEREPAVAEHRAQLDRRVVDVGEPLWVAREPVDDRIDLVRGPLVPRARVRDERTRAEPDEADLEWPLRGGALGEDLPERSLAMVVGQRLVALRRVDPLQPVERAAVEQQVLAALRLDHAMDPEEAALLVQELPAADRERLRRDQQRRDAEPEPHGPARERQHEERRPGEAQEDHHARAAEPELRHQRDGGERQRADHDRQHDVEHAERVSARGPVGIAGAIMQASTTTSGYSSTLEKTEGATSMH
jgi:hypothetical protein